MIMMEFFQKSKIVEILKSLTIEPSVSACFYKITIFTFSFSNAKWM